MKIVFVEPPSTKDRPMIHEKAWLKEHCPDAEVSVAVLDEDSDDRTRFFADVADADIIIKDYVYFGKPELDAMKNCKVISYEATGYNSIDIDYATELGIPVASILDYCTQETAENAFALMLCLQRHTLEYNRSIQIERVWDNHYLPTEKLRRIEGQTMGIAGLGRIGKSVARKAHGFGMEVIAYDPFIPESAAAECNVRLVDIDTFLAESDVISIHMNLSKDNYHFFDKEKFAKCKKQPIIINEGRGPLICEDDLLWALDNGLVRGAGLDMLESEFPDLEHCKLLGRDDVILNPHCGYLSMTSDYLNAALALENALLCYEGRYSEAKVVRNGHELGLF